MKFCQVFPRPETSEFQHLHSFLCFGDVFVATNGGLWTYVQHGIYVFNWKISLICSTYSDQADKVGEIPDFDVQTSAAKKIRWHSTYDAFPNGAPVPVALQPPNAVPHLVEFHHQRGANKLCFVLLCLFSMISWKRLGKLLFPRFSEHRISDFFVSAMSEANWPWTSPVRLLQWRGCLWIGPFNDFTQRPNDMDALDGMEQTFKTAWRHKFFGFKFNVQLAGFCSIEVWLNITLWHSFAISLEGTMIRDVYKSHGPKTLGFISSGVNTDIGFSKSRFFFEKSQPGKCWHLFLFSSLIRLKQKQRAVQEPYISCPKSVFSGDAGCEHWSLVSQRSVERWCLIWPYGRMIRETTQNQITAMFCILLQHITTATTVQHTVTNFWCTTFTAEELPSAPLISQDSDKAVTSLKLAFRTWHAIGHQVESRNEV